MAQSEQKGCRPRDDVEEAIHYSKAITVVGVLAMFLNCEGTNRAEL